MILFIILISALLAYSEPPPVIPSFWIFLKSDWDINNGKTHDDIIGQLNSSGFHKRYESRWLNAFSGYASADVLERVKALPFVKNVRPVALYRKAAPPVSLAKINFPINPLYGRSYDPLNLIGVLKFDSIGRIPRTQAGKGIRMALFDSGFRTSHRAFAHFTDSTIIAKRDYVAGMVDTSIPFDTSVADDSLDFKGQEDHGTSVLSLIAAYDPGTMMGVAPFARFVLLKTERTFYLNGMEAETWEEEAAWIAALEWVVDSVGVDIVSTSLGYRYDFTDNRADYPIDSLDGHSLPITRAANYAAKKGVVVIASAGNEGNSRPSPSISAPADGDSVIAVGATDAFGRIALFTSYGPNGDTPPKTKPDISAPGWDIIIAQASGGYANGSGTSFAAPMAAGACALFLQSFDSFKGHPIETMHRLMSTSYFPSNISVADRSNPRYGAGIINLYAALLDTQIVTPYIPPEQLSFRVVPQPVHKNKDAFFLLNVPKDVGINSNQIQCHIKIYSLSGNLISSTTQTWPDLNLGQNGISMFSLLGKSQAMAVGIYLVSAQYNDNYQEKSWLQKMAIIP